MGFSLELCPVVYGCCGRVPLRVGCGCIAALGALAAAALLCLYAGAGAAAAHELNVTAAVSVPARHACFIFGVLLCAVHLLLLLATVFRSEALCQLYVWFMLVYLLVFTACALVFALAAALSDADMVFVFATLAAVLVYDSLTLYFIVVVANFRMTLP